MEPVNMSVFVTPITYVIGFVGLRTADLKLGKIYPKLENYFEK